MPERPEVPETWVRRLRAVLCALPDCHEESAWVGVRWRVGSATVAHVFGGEDQLFRITFRGEPDEVAELLTDSYCLQAPARLADQVSRPG